MTNKPSKLTPEELFEREFLPARSKILELAATLDRLDRAGASDERNGGSNESRRALIEQALKLLLEPHDNRAERIQQLFSREYDAGWYDAWLATGVDKRKGR